jgi:biopolymer transport protein ExbB
MSGRTTFRHRGVGGWIGGFLLVAVLAANSAVSAESEGASAAAEEGTPLTLEGLLESVRQGRAADRVADDERLRRFEAQQEEQERLLAEITAERVRLEGVSAAKEGEFEGNEQLIGELEVRLQERMGTLKELFGVLQQVAGDAQAQFHGSLTQLDHPARTEFLVDFAGRMGQANRLPEMSEIESVWFELLREMTESGRVETAPRTVVTSEGAEVVRDVTRVGLFNAVAEGRYLKFIPETGRLVEFGRQPAGRYLTGLEALAEGDAGVVPVAVDPVRGQLLDILTQAPNLLERIAQGGAIGYAIIALGTFGVLFALARLAILTVRGRAIQAQLQRLDAPTDDNALGRILLAAKEADVQDVDALELRIGEAVLRETPSINAYLPLLKIIAAVAPLMGLLGTVTGMIITFQAITLFGAGDPRLMAGGISQALVTTVLGLCVAVPMLLLHNVVQMRARAVTEILQQKAVSVVSQRAETLGDRSGQGLPA